MPAYTGFTSPLVHSPVSNQAPYGYRNGTGMQASAEFYVHHDDFTSKVASNIPTGWENVIIDSGSTVTTYTTQLDGAQGVVALFDATASEGASIYLPKTISLKAGKKFWMEARIYTDDITDNDFQMGLSSLTATTNPEDLWLTASDSLISFGILDGSATTVMLADKANSGSTVQTGSLAIAATTWTTLAISYDGLSSVKGWVNGRESLTWSSAFATTVPVGVLLAPFVGARNGNGAGSNVNLVDYVRVVCER